MKRYQKKLLESSKLKISSETDQFSDQLLPTFLEYPGNVDHLCLQESFQEVLRHLLPGLVIAILALAWEGALAVSHLVFLVG